VSDNLTFGIFCDSPDNRNHRYWQRTIPLASTMSQVHFIDIFQKFVDSVVEQTRDRANDRILSFDEYWAIRWYNCGCLPSFAFGELELDLPDEVYYHPLLEKMREIAIQMIAASNVSFMLILVFTSFGADEE